MRYWGLLLVSGAALADVGPASATRATTTVLRGATPAVATWADMVDADQRGVAAGESVQEAAPWLPSGPCTLPVPPDVLAARMLAPASEPAVRDEPPVTLAPPVTLGFLGLPDSGTTIPPDTDGAVGPQHVMTALNSQVRIQNRTGGIISTITLAAFWSSLGVSDVFDPKVVFDPLSGRYVFVSCAQRRSAASSLLLAVSATNDPTGTWYRYQLDGDAANTKWVDYPNLGANQSWFTLTANMFGVSGDAFAGVNVWAIDKASVLSGSAITYTLFFRTSEGGTFVPCLTYSPTESTQYVANSWNAEVGVLHLYTITGGATAPVFTATGFFPASTPWNNTPADAPQLGSAQLIETNDGRLMQAALRNGRLWCVHSAGMPAVAPTRASVKWWEINPVTGATMQSGVIDDPLGGAFYYYPSIAVNQTNAVLIGFTGSSATTYAGAYYAYRASTDASGTLQPVALLKAGENPYFKDFGTGRNRWGDYSMTMVDPVDDLSFWTIQEYAYTPANTWSTWWGYFSQAVTSVTLQVNSAYGMALPPAGTATYAHGTTITCAITNSPASFADATHWQSCLCTGWVGTGSVPALGSGTNTGSLMLLADSSITWLWTLTDLAVSNQVLAVTSNLAARDTLTAGPDYTVAPSGNVTLRAGKSVRLLPGFTARTGSVLRATVP
ncbi:MAG: hypothetical protein K8T26_00835 [Lentisphaerae bacterium]|nr:hypothetical protein [Lentisphaerota bacterium]